MIGELDIYNILALCFTTQCLINEEIVEQVNLFSMSKFGFNAMEIELKGDYSSPQTSFKVGIDEYKH